MSDINLTSAIRTNLSSLQSTATLLGKTQEKLATGLKVNSALDNPASFFTSKRLNDRASDLASRKDGIGQGIQTLKAADKTLQALNKLVSSAKSLANRAIDEDATTRNTYIKASVAATDPNSVAFVTTAQASITITLDKEDGSVETITYSVASGATVQDVVDGLNAFGAISAELDDDNFLVIKAKGEEYTGFDITNPDVAQLHLDGSAAVSTVETDPDAVDARADLAAEFDDLRTQMSQLIDDAGYKGVNLLKSSDLSVKFNENGQSKLDISGVNFDVTEDSSDIHIAASTNNWVANTDIEAAIEDIDAAVTAMRTQASTFGSNLSVLEVRDTFTKDMISTLEEGAGKLVQADMNQEAANLLALQTRQQLATTSLSMASQAEQGVLRLF